MAHISMHAHVHMHVHARTLSGMPSMFALYTKLRYVLVGIDFCLLSTTCTAAAACTYTCTGAAGQEVTAKGVE
jgi:hypothetical protein